MNAKDTNVPSDPHRSSPTRIWAVCEYYYPNFSGAAIQAHRILSRLAVDGFSVCVWTTADQDARRLAEKPVILDGVRIEYLPVIRRRGWMGLRLGSRFQQAAQSLNQLLRGFSFQTRIAWRVLRRAQRGDILQFYIVDEFTWMVLAAARLRKVHSVIQISLVGADDPSSFRSSLLGISTAAKRACFHQVDRVIGLSRALTDSCYRAGVPSKAVIRIPNGVDLQQFTRMPDDKSAVRRRLGLDPDRTYVAFVGSALQRKGIDVVIDAFLAGCAARDDVDLLIVGPCDFSDRTRHSPDRQRLVDTLRQRITDHGFAPRVHWIGRVDHVQDYLHASDLFFFPTRREGLPNALAEAMACGLPVLASRVEGVTTDLVDSGCEGILVDGDDATRYADALASLLQNPERLSRMGAAARKTIEQNFAVEKIVQRYADLYREIVEEKQ